LSGASEEVESVRIVTLDSDPARVDELVDLSAAVWPVFMQHGDARCWSTLYRELARYQTLFLDDADRVQAAGLAAPCAWSGRRQELPATIDAILHKANHPDPGTVPTYLCAVAAIARPDSRGRGLSREILEQMIAVARREGLHGLIAPVRPTRKAEHPAVPFEEYVQWRRPDGQLYDPWLRTHERLGGTPLGIAPATYTVRGTVAEWEAWTGQTFAVSGRYEVEGALTLVQIDRENDVGLYVEPNYWFLHRVEGSNQIREENRESASSGRFGSESRGPTRPPSRTDRE
jgi:GNAT superfamily N-acetyltransferase